MADTTITLTAGVWTLVTENDTATFSCQNQGGLVIELKATADTTAPTDSLGSRHLKPYGGFSEVISDVWPGVPGAKRIWARCDGPAKLAVSYV